VRGAAQRDVLLVVVFLARRFGDYKLSVIITIAV
jgi:hypothetical protein